MKNYAFLVAIVCLCFTMCKKEDIQVNYCYSNSLLSQINSGDEAVHGLTYNSNCILYESTEPFVYKKYFYSDQNQLIKVELAYSFNAFSCVMVPGQSTETDPRKAEVSEYYEFDYGVGSQISRKSSYFNNSGNPQLVSYQTFYYVNNQIAKLSTYNPQGLLMQYHDYQYDENGNLTKDDFFTNYTTLILQQSASYEYDNKKNPFQVFAGEGLPGLYTNKNNIIKETIISYSVTNEDISTTQNVYEYNNLDYPVKVNDLDYKYGK